MIYMVTATITSLWSILLQHLLHPYDPYCYSNYYVFKTYIVTAHIMSFWTILLLQLLRPYDLYGYNNYHISMIHTATATITSLWFILLQPIPSLWSLYPVNVRHAPIAATGDPRQMRHTRSGQEDATPNIQEYAFCVIILFFFCYCHFCYSISAELKTISREDAHLMYPRYLRVFSFVMIYCPLPHPISVRTGWGYHCRVVVRLLAFFAKLNWFFPKIINRYLPSKEYKSFLHWLT